MIYKIRIILDVKDDVFRDLIVDNSINLEELHYIIAKSFGFIGQEMASFYKTNKNWEQGEEIPLFDMSELGDAPTMNTYTLKDVLKNVNDKLIYIYDFMALWTFFVELTEIKEKCDKELPRITLSFGNVPEEVPEKEFKSENLNDDFDMPDDENNFENIDDYDF
jgi:hypothetical protein